MAEIHKKTLLSFGKMSVEITWFFFFQGRDPASLAPYKEAYRLEAAAEEYSEGGRPGGRPGGAAGKPPKPERLGGKALVFAAAAAAAAAAA